jgi:hypothetical protein
VKYKKNYQINWIFQKIIYYKTLKKNDINCGEEGDEIKNYYLGMIITKL